MTQASEAAKKEFVDMLPKAARMHALSWCMKYQCVVVTGDLWALRCWDCPMFVMNEGACDPL